MRMQTIAALATLVFAGSVSALGAQTPQGGTSSTTVPRVVRISGRFHPANGQPVAPVEGVTLAIYAEETGGVPLWQESQNLVMGLDGSYSVLMGATAREGLPLDLFSTNEPRWVGLRFDRPGERELPRTQLVSVVFALKAADAETLGGRPPSAYLLAEPGASEGAAPTRTSAGATSTGASGGKSTTASALSLSAGTVNYVGKFVTATDLGNSAIYDAGGFVGVNTTTPFDALHVRFMNTNGAFTGYAVQNLGNTPTSYSGMLFYDQNGALGQFQGFNNSTHEYRINNIASGGSINFMLGSVPRFRVRPDGDVDIAGNIHKGGAPFLASFPIANTFLGEGAGNFTMTGNSNTASGWSALQFNTTGQDNTASGSVALGRNTTGNANTATGSEALYFNTSGRFNTASGWSALQFNTTGWYNTASGSTALNDNTIGDFNVAVGYRAGVNATIGSNNIYLGANVEGIAGESNTMYIGRQGTQTKTVIAGIRGITTGSADAVPVVIDSAGQLGTVSSSRRFKEDIQDMGEASRAIFALRPVTFRYVKPFTNGAKPLQYGLVAEEVAAVFPALAVPNADGGVDTVHYETLSVLLLNEVQQQQQRIQEQQQRIETLERRLEALLAKPDSSRTLCSTHFSAGKEHEQ